jgi:hypothetical protein
VTSKAKKWMVTLIRIAMKDSTLVGMMVTIRETIWG